MYLKKKLPKNRRRLIQNHPARFSGLNFGYKLLICWWVLKCAAQCTSKPGLINQPRGEGRKRFQAPEFVECPEIERAVSVLVTVVAIGTVDFRN